MIGYLLLNGEAPKRHLCAICDDSIVVCCDGAYEWAKKYSIMPDVIVGDMDSIISELPKDVKNLKYDSEKDYSDGQIGLDYLLHSSCSEIVIYGGGGFRDDHALMNYNLLYKGLINNCDIKMITNYAVIFLADKNVHLKNVKNRTVSIVPFIGNTHILRLEGYKYPLENTVLDYQSSLTLSNVAVEDEVDIIFQDGVIAVFIIH